ncbi:MAG: hypothetical protein J0L58_20785 [Burkholderiales bacterium]|nr:hypothetical protein [Burkholderiales bacterium]
MLTLHTLEQRQASQHQRGSTWYELVPGPDDGKWGASDGAFFWIDEWENVGEQLIGERLPGYSRYEQFNCPAPVWPSLLDYLQDVSIRLRKADEPAMVHVLLPELTGWLRWELSKGFPEKPRELANDLDAITEWVRCALKRWHSITFKGL